MTTATRRFGLIEARATRLMTDSAVVRRATETPDGAGGTTTTWADQSPVPCRLWQQATTPLEAAAGGRIVAVTLWTAYLPAVTDVRPADELVVNGATYEVLEANGPATDAAFVAVTLRRVH